MQVWFKAAYILCSVVLLAMIWNSIDAPEGGEDFFGRLMAMRFMGFVALMLLFYYIFFNFLGRRKKEKNGKQ